MTSTCTIPGCERKMAARGLCHTHWALWKETGRSPCATPLGSLLDPGGRSETVRLDPRYSRRNRTGWARGGYRIGRASGTVGFRLSHSPVLSPMAAKDGTRALDPTIYVGKIVVT